MKALILLVLLPLAAQAQSWVALGPEAGEVTALAVDPRTPDRVLAATTEGGTFRSINGGATWVPASKGLEVNSIPVVLADPSAASTFWAATGSGLFKTSNSGDSWAEVDTGLTGPGKSLVVLTVDLASATTFFAASNVSDFGADATFLRSTNGGTTWEPLTVPVVQDSVSAFAANGATWYVGTWSGLFKTTNSGGTWAQSDNGIVVTDGGASTTIIDSIVIDPALPSRVFAGTGLGLYRSTDSGATWAMLGGGLPAMRTGPVVMTASALYTSVGAQVFTSTDHGDTWSSVSTGLGSREVKCVAVDPTRPARLFVGSRGDGVYASTDTGASWAPSNKGLGATWVTSVMVDPKNAATLIIGTETSGGYRSVDQGLNWARLDLTTSPLDIVGGFAHSTDGNTLYSAVNTPALARGSVNVSTDHGATWAPVAGGPKGPFSALAVGSAGPVAARCLDQVFVNAGGTWSPSPTLNDTCVVSLAVDPTTPARLYASAIPGTLADAGMALRGVFASSNGGMTWASISAGLPTDASPGPLAADTNVVYLAMYGANALFVSTNQGASWVTHGGLPGAIQTMQVDSATHVLFAATAAGVFATVDRGATWQNLTSNLPNIDVTSFAPGTGVDVLYAGTAATGLYVLRGVISFDGGVAFDAGMGTQDAGASGDGGVANDGGAVADAGSPGDAGAVGGDAGTGPGADAGAMSGADAGSAPDGGSGTDAGAGSGSAAVGRCGCNVVDAPMWVGALVMLGGLRLHSRRRRPLA